MKDLDLHPLPTTGAVLKEQTWAVGLALRRLGIGVGILLIVFGVYGLYDNLIGGVHKGTPVVGLPADFLIYLSLVGLGLPIFIRRGPVTPFRAGIPWTLPVERARHALLRVGGGWLWLMAAVAILLLWGVGIPFLSGGALVEPQTLLVAPFTDPRPMDPASLPTVLWSMPWWLWLVPFLAATVLYLFSSALFLATPYPGRWLVGTILGVLLLAVVADWVNIMWLLDPPAQVLNSLTAGRYGLSTLVTGATAAIPGVDLPSGESMSMFVGLPTFGRWLASACIWTGVGMAFLGLAALRHRDGTGVRVSD